MKFIFAWKKDFPLKDKLHMFAPPCNIPYIYCEIHSRNILRSWKASLSHSLKLSNELWRSFLTPLFILPYKLSLNNCWTPQSGIDGPIENDLLFQLWFQSSADCSTAAVSQRSWVRFPMKHESFFHFMCLLST